MIPRTFMHFIAILLLYSLFFSSAQAETLKIGLLPIADTILLHTAQRQGFFSQMGLDVELIPFQSAVEKDAAVQSGQLDGHFCEIASVIVQRASGLAFLVVATTSHTDPRHRMFGLVTSPNSDARNISDLKGKKLAIARQTITDFLTDVILAEVGQPDDLMERLDIRKIPVRLQMLLAGQADAALFPEPLLSIAEQAGGLVLADDRRLVMPLAVVALSQSKATPETIKAFQEALARAAKAINKEPAHYRALMLELGLIPPQLAESFVLPPFDLDKVPLALPDRTLFEAYVKWLIKTGTLTEKPGGLNPPPFEEVVYQGLN